VSEEDAPEPLETDLWALCKDTCTCAHCGVYSTKLWAMEHGSGLGEFETGRDMWRFYALCGWSVAAFFFLLWVLKAR
jgi:hypothetical protein